MSVRVTNARNLKTLPQARVGHFQGHVRHTELWIVRELI